jgi:hypothetical protein
MVSASQDQPTRDELLQTVRHVADLAKETQAELDAEKTAHSAVATELAQATAQNQSLQTAIDSMSARCNKAIADLDHVLEKLHLAKWIMTGLALAACALLAFQIPPPIGLYAGGAAAVAATTAIWIFI